MGHFQLCGLKELRFNLTTKRIIFLSKNKSLAGTLATSFVSFILNLKMFAAIHKIRV